MKILKTEELTAKYVDLRNKVLKYIEEFEIDIDNLYKYFKNNEKALKLFFNYYNMEFNSHNRIILMDVILDLGISESVNNNFEKNHEKFIADYFRISIGHVKLIDSDISLYEVNEYGSKFKIIVLDSKQIISLVELIIDKIIKRLKTQDIVLHSDIEQSYIQTTKPGSTKDTHIEKWINFDGIKEEIKKTIKKEDLAEWLIKMYYNDYPSKVNNFEEMNEGYISWYIS